MDNPRTSHERLDANQANQGGTDQPAAPPASGTSGRQSGPSMPMPHERDQSHQAVNAKPQAVIAQAKRDLDAGMVDTDMRSTPGLDAERRAQLVPGSAGAPAASATGRSQP